MDGRSIASCRMATRACSACPTPSWSSALLAGIAAYRARRNAIDPLDGPALRPIAEATLEDRADRLLLAASVLLRGSMAAECLPDLEALLTSDHLKAGLRAQRERSGRSKFTMSDVHVALACSEAAHVMLGPDAPALDGIEFLRQRLKQPQRGVSDRARTRLAPLDCLTRQAARQAVERHVGAERAEQHLGAAPPDRQAAEDLELGVGGERAEHRHEKRRRRVIEPAREARRQRVGAEREAGEGPRVHQALDHDDVDAARRERHAHGRRRRGGRGVVGRERGARRP